jgi:hypothetical protein
VFSGRYENLGICLGVGEWIFESEQDFHGAMLTASG